MLDRAALQHDANAAPMCEHAPIIRSHVITEHLEADDRMTLSVALDVA